MRTKSARIVKISILKWDWIIKKNSDVRRDYESVDEKSLSYAMSRKTKWLKEKLNKSSCHSRTKKKIHNEQKKYTIKKLTTLVIE